MWLIFLKTSDAQFVLSVIYKISPAGVKKKELEKKRIADEQKKKQLEEKRIADELKKKELEKI